MNGFGVGSLGKKDKDGMGVGWGTVGKGEAWLCATGAGASVALGEAGGEEEQWCCHTSPCGGTSRPPGTGPCDTDTPRRGRRGQNTLGWN